MKNYLFVIFLSLLLITTSSPVSANTINSVLDLTSSDDDEFEKVFRLGDNYVFYFNTIELEFVVYDTSNKQSIVHYKNITMTDFQYFSEIYSHGQYLYLITNDKKLSVYNADPDNFNLISSLSHPTSDFSLTNGIFQRGNYLYISHRYSYSIVDVTDINNMKVLDSETLEMASNVYVDICGLSDDNNTLYLTREILDDSQASYTHSYHLTSIDVSDKSAVKKIADLEYDQSTVGFARTCETQHGKAIIGHTKAVQIYDVINPAAMKLEKSFSKIDNGRAIDIRWPFAFIAEEAAVSVINLGTDTYLTETFSHPIGTALGISDAAFQDGGDQSTGLLIFIANGAKFGAYLATDFPYNEIDPVIYTSPQNSDTSSSDNIASSSSSTSNTTPLTSQQTEDESGIETTIVSFSIVIAVFITRQPRGRQ